MPTQISGALGRLQESIRQFTVAQRTLGLIGVAVLVLGVAALSSWLAKPTMSPLFANISTTDASAIVDQLQAEGVPYELTDGGSTILVPADRLYAMRLAAAAAGLPKGSDGGYSLLDDMGMTSSEFQQQVTYQRALEGELAKTIGSITGVEAATVRLALPEKSVFVSETADPTASVFVKTAPGGGLSGDKVQSIVHLVSAGIEGMAPTDVAVIDADGKVLSAVGGAGSTGMQDGQVGEYEGRVASNVQAMLDRIVGPGNAVVSVSAELDYDQTNRTSETFAVEGEVPPLSSATTLEEYTGGAGATGGVLGPDNIMVPAGEQGTGEYRKETATENNAVNKVTEQLVSAPGSVRRQSVSVVVSQEAAAGLDLVEVQGMVGAAAGVVEERGDVVSVSRMVFDASGAEVAQEALAAAAAQQEAVERSELIRTGILAGVVLLTFILALVTAARRSRRARRQALDLGALEIVESRAPEAIEAEKVTLPVLEAPVATIQDGITAKREDVMALAAEQPAEVAEMLRGWLVEGKR
ncbi:flagellar basal-body MS-ring/collar protein FliF [Actinotalea sp. K2]|uniref:flagellar basal-body MS-ring/collar protein FliF n=1 Tax=Actinotalea sp. K2 TaxID=2939438 RepID=UPI00201767FE|nr:flagellar basal-body MS-ring/collar protein FliF [Actinotalea sp. K2]MCL3860856.1 flagellar M-ring protein FliF [Actinotalea sp. K2]